MRDVKFTCAHRTQYSKTRLNDRAKRSSRAEGVRDSDGCAAHLRRLEWIVRGEVDVQEEHATCVRAFRLHGQRSGQQACGQRVPRRDGIRRPSGSARARGFSRRTGPMMVACQWKRSSPFGPALQLDGGSRLISASSCASSGQCGVKEGGRVVLKVFFLSRCALAHPWRAECWCVWSVR